MGGRGIQNRVIERKSRVEDLANVNVEGSTPFTRFHKPLQINDLQGFSFAPDSPRTSRT